MPGGPVINIAVHNCSYFSSNPASPWKSPQSHDSAGQENYVILKITHSCKCSTFQRKPTVRDILKITLALSQSQLAEYEYGIRILYR